MRIDKLLWFLRFAKSRSLAQKLVDEGHIRLNGRRVERCAQPICPGDILTIPVGNAVRVIRMVILPTRRGPAPEAQACYQQIDETLDDKGAYPLAGGQYRTAMKGDLQP